MWFDILKETKQTSRQLSSLNWDEEEIPEKEENNCLKQLKEYYDKAKNHPASIQQDKNSNYFKFSPVPEEVACAVVERIKSIKKSDRSTDYRKIDINDNTYWYVVRYHVYKDITYGEKYLKFRVLCYDLEEKTLIRFGTKSSDLDEDIDFR